jgi:hypothetical protein
MAVGIGECGHLDAAVVAPGGRRVTRAAGQAARALPGGVT